jgi:hypothetical protein
MEALYEVLARIFELRTMGDRRTLLGDVLERRHTGGTTLGRLARFVAYAAYVRMEVLSRPSSLCRGRLHAWLGALYRIEMEAFFKRLDVPVFILYLGLLHQRSAV